MPEHGVLRVVSNAELESIEAEELEIKNAAEEAAAREDQAVDSLAAYVRRQYENFRWHRNKFALPRRYLANLRAYNGHYSADKLTEIKKFGGSNVFAKMTGVKCRGAAALLRDVFLSMQRPWELQASPVPELPDDISQSIQELLNVEQMTMQNAGQPVDPEVLKGRQEQLFAAAYNAAQKQAKEQAALAEDHLDDTLREGKFYEAMSDFLLDLTIFPFACIKGPEIKRVVKLNWTDGELGVEQQPKMFWRRVSPFDLYFTPGASNVEDADVIERQRLSRKDLNQLLGLPGYREEAIRAVLADYDRGINDWLDEGETERANEENKENPYINDSELLDTLEYHGAVKGEWLEEFGFEDIEDPDKDYHVVCWIIGNHVIKVQMNPNPKQRHPYYVTNFERIPGSIYGNALPEILSDVQDVANAAFRSLVNNMSIASGPQVAVNEERLSPTTNADDMYPWKRWRFISDPMGMDTGVPISFFQPDSNAPELLGVYRSMMDAADEVSAIPRYITGGNQATGGAASTASGLSMLMNNASKVLQNVAASIDKDILSPTINDLYIMQMLTDKTGMLRGDENVVVKGVSVAAAKETDRMRQLELLQLTANPIDMQIIGPEGRASLLRSVSDNVGMPYDSIVPSEQELMTKLAQETQTQGAMGVQEAKPDGQARQGEEFDNMHRMNA